MTKPCATEMSHRIGEYNELRAAQIVAFTVADHIDRAAAFRLEQADEHAARDAATYRELARLLRGEHDDVLLGGIVCGELRVLLGLAKLDPNALVRLIQNEVPTDGQ